MDFMLSGGDLAWVIALAAGLGAVGGLISDLVDPLKEADDRVSTDLDNRITLPHSFREEQTGVRTVDFGFVGPPLVGAVAALIVVFALGVSGPAADEAAQATANLSEAVVADEAERMAAGEEDSGRGAPDAQAGETNRAEAEDKATDQLGEKVAIQLLIPLALIGGFAGPLVMRTARTRLTRVLDAAVGQARDLSGETARLTVVQEIRDSEALAHLDDVQRNQLARDLGEKVEVAVQETTDSVLAWEPGREASPGEPSPPAPTEGEVSIEAPDEGEGSVDASGGDGGVERTPDV